MDSNLNPNTTYCYRIYFLNAYARSPFSDERCATTLQDAPPIPQGKPDLVITSLRAPTTVSVGNGTSKLQNVSLTVANNGPVSAGRFRVEFYWSHDDIITVDDIPAVSYFIPSSLGPKEVKTLDDWNITYFTVNIPSSLSPGVYYLGAIIDDSKETTGSGTYKALFGGQVAESDETNNAHVADTGKITLSGPPQPPTPTSPSDGFSYTYTLFDYREPTLGKQIFEWQKKNPNDTVEGQIFNGSKCEGTSIGALIIDAPWDFGYIMKDFFPAGKTYSWHILERANGVSSAPSECRSFSVQAEAR